MDFAEAAARLDTRGMFGITLGLERVRELFDRARIDTGSIKFLHIAGTNGKGSVGAMLQGMLRDGISSWMPTYQNESFFTALFLL